MVNETISVQLLHEMLTNVVKADADGHPYLTVVLSFARSCAEDIAGIMPRRQRLLLRKYAVEAPQSEVCVC